MSDLRRRMARLLALDTESLSFCGHSGITSKGSRSSAPRATNRPNVVDRFCCMVLVVLIVGSGGALSGVGVGVFLAHSAPRDLGRRMVDARRILLGATKLVVEVPSSGAVWGVLGAGVMGVRGPLPWLRPSDCFFAGEMAILASESFIEMDRRRRWAVGCFLIMGEAALVVAFS